MFEKVRAIIAEQLGIDKEKIQPESHLINDLKADSLDVVALVMDLEQELKEWINTDVLKEIHSDSLTYQQGGETESFSKWAAQRSASSKA